MRYGTKSRRQLHCAHLWHTVKHISPFEPTTLGADDITVKPNIVSHQTDTALGISGKRIESLGQIHAFTQSRGSVYAMNIDYSSGIINPHGRTIISPSRTIVPAASTTSQLRRTIRGQFSGHSVHGTSLLSASPVVSTSTISVIPARTGAPYSASASPTITAVSSSAASYVRTCGTRRTDSNAVILASDAVCASDKLTAAERCRHLRHRRHIATMARHTSVVPNTIVYVAFCSIADMLGITQRFGCITV